MPEKRERSRGRIRETYVGKRREETRRLGLKRERNPFLVIVGTAACPDLELSVSSFVTASEVDALVVSSHPFD